MRLLCIFSVAILILSSCYNDSEETLFPQSAISTQQCDTTVFNFSGDIKPIIDGNCISCHNIQAPVLDNYANIASNATRILGAIKHQSGYIAMPPGAATQLDDCKIIKFEKWIAAGKKND